MKTLMFLSVLCVTQAFAQELTVELTSKEMTVAASDLMLVKTEATPNSVTLNVPVEKVTEVCREFGERQVTTTNGERCGYDVVTRPGYGPGPYYPGPSGRRVIVRRPTHGPGPIGPRGGYYPSYPRGGYYSGPITERIPRTCTYMETFCTQSEMVTETVYRKYLINFEKFDRDATFNLKLTIDSADIEFIDPSNACVKKTFYKTGADLKLKRDCR